MSLFSKTLILIPIFLIGCSTAEEKYKEKPVGLLYNEAMDHLSVGDFKKAAKSFEEVDRQHPYSPWATRAQLMAAYTQYREMRYDQAIGSLDAFIQLHPGSPQIDYAYYLKALSYYEQISPVEKDQQVTEAALAAMEEVRRRFPNTNYAKDVKFKIDLTRDHLAGKEMEVGRFYLMMHEPVAALNRFKTVVEKYQITSHVPEALHRMVECYMSLGIRDEAQAAAAVLGYNFPDNSWYKDSYDLLQGNGLKPDQSKTSKSWVGSVWGPRFKKVK